MKTASVTEIKARLSHYLRMAKRGSEVQILERGVPIARLVGILGEGNADDARVEELEKAGILRRGTGELDWLMDEPPMDLPDLYSGSSLSSALQEDREDRG